MAFPHRALLVELALVQHPPAELVQTEHHR